MNEPEEEFLPEQAASFATWIANQQFPRVQEVVPVFSTVGVYVDPLFDPELLPRELPALEEREIAQKLVEVRMSFDAEVSDFEEVCKLLSVSKEEFIGNFLASEFTVGAMGFCPGFPYLLGLDEKLQGLKRKETPRKHVPAGSIAIVEDQACIYTMNRPGGWWIIGHTSDRLVELEDNFCAFSTGDKVRFVQK